MHRVKSWLLLIIAITFVVYAPSFANGFTYDDFDVVRVPGGEDGGANKLVAELQPLSVYFSTSYSESHGGLGRGFRPITILSFAIVHALSRTQNPLPDGPFAPAWPQHVLNVVLHCGAVWLTFEFLALFLGAGLGALVGAGVFGIHALHSDPVISIVGRAEVMGYVFGMTSLLFYVAALRRKGGKRWWRLAAGAGSLFLAVCSKESAAPWIVFIPLTVVALRLVSDRDHGRKSLPPWRAQIGPWLFSLALPFAVFMWMLFRIWSHLEFEFRPAFESNPLWFGSVVERVVNGVIILGYGLYKIFLPLHLAHDYSEAVFTLATGVGDARFLGTLAVLSAVLMGGILGARRRPLLFLAVAGFFGFTFLTSNIPFAVETIFGERLLYTPSFALSILLAWVFDRLHTARGRRIALVSVGVWALIGAGLIVKRDLDWRDNKTLFSTDAEVQPRSIRVQMTLMKYLRRGDPMIWKRKIDQAHAINPKAPVPLRELAFFYLTMRQFAEAEKYARLGLATDHPDIIDQAPELDLLLAQALEAQGKMADALEALRAAVALTEANPQASDPRKRIELGEFFRRTGALQQAKMEFLKIYRSTPGFLPVWDQLLFLAQAEKKDKEVEALVAEGRRRFPGAPQFALQAAILARRRGDVRRAAEVFDQAIRFLPEAPATLEYFEFYARIMMQQNRVDDARRLVAGILRLPGLRVYQVDRLVALANTLGMRPGK